MANRKNRKKIPIDGFIIVTVEKRRPNTVKELIELVKQKSRISE